MASAERRRLIVTADDFGRSASINQAVEQAHRDGVLTCASLMVNGVCFDQAVQIAKRNPNLGVGLHLTLCCGRATLGPDVIPGLVNEDGTLPESAVAAGLAYFFSKKLRAELQDEIAAQFEKFEATGLRCDHINGHLHMHMHPAVFPMIIAQARKRGIRGIRLTSPTKMEWQLGQGRWVYRGSHWGIFRGLAVRARKHLSGAGLAYSEHVFGLLEDTRVTEEFVLKLLPELPVGNSELYSHPSLEEFAREYEALMSERVRRTVGEQKIELIRYQDL